MSSKHLKLRHADLCSLCAVELDIVTTAEWNAVSHVATCLTCVEVRDHPVTDGIEADTQPLDLRATPADVDFDAPRPLVMRGLRSRRLRDHRSTRHRRLVGLAPRTTRSEPHVVGKQDVSAQRIATSGPLTRFLTQRFSGSARLLNDRISPDNAHHIDRIVVAPSGVWIIDANEYSGKIEHRDTGSPFMTDYRLFVGGRDQTRRVTGLLKQRDIVTETFRHFLMVPVHCILTFTNGDWPLLRRPQIYGDVMVCWPERLADMMAVDGPVSPEDIADIANIIEAALPKAGNQT